MAEIILPPEEETPQVPELNIDKPSGNSKVITIEFEAKKTNKVSTKDTNQQLYTTDTDAWFEFKETSLEGANGTYSVVFRNRHDGSIFQRTGDVVNGVAYYKIPHQEIRHAGAWRGQIVYTLSNGDTTAREFDYDVKGHILDGKDVREIVVEDFETLMSQLRSMKDNAEVELASLKQELENTTDTAEQNETDRQAFFDGLVEDIDELQANYQELLDTGVLQTNINTKLEQLEEEYAPKLTEVTTQLGHIINDKAYIEVTNFDAISDGVTDNSEIFQDLINLGYGLDLQGKTFLINKPVRVNNDLRIRNGKILGNVNVNGFVLEGGNLVELDNIELSNTKYAIFFNQAEVDEINVKINNSKFENNQYSLTNMKFPQQSTHYTFSITNSEFKKCRASDIYIYNTIIDYCNVSGCQFLDGYNEALNFSPNKQLSGFYFFDNNKFFNYTSTLSGDDADAHFIRCYGEKAVVTNNIFQGLYLGEGVLGNDTEALRPNCDEIIIDSNIFIDAGYQEAFLSLKGGYNCVVTNNLFEVTDEYNEMANSVDDATIAILLGAHTNVVSNNRFVNFTGTCIDTEDGHPAIIQVIDIHDNIFEDCRCHKYSGQYIIRITATNSPNKNVYVRGNKVFNTTGIRTPIFLYVHSCDKVFIEDNHIDGVGRVFRGHNSGYVYLRNNHISDFGRVFDSNGCRNYTECTGNRYTNITSHYSLVYIGANVFRLSMNNMILHNETFEFENQEGSTRLIMLPGTTGVREQYVTYRMSIKDSPGVTDPETEEEEGEVTRVFIKAECWLKGFSVVEHSASNYLKSNNSSITNYLNTSNLLNGSISTPEGLSGTNSIIITIDDLTAF